MDNPFLIVWATGLATFPLWGTGAFMGTLKMNASNRGKTMERARKGCLLSLLALPVAMGISVYKLYYQGYSHFAAVLPLLPAISYYVLIKIGYSSRRS